MKEYALSLPVAPFRRLLSALSVVVAMLASSPAFAEDVTLSLALQVKGSDAAPGGIDGGSPVSWRRVVTLAFGSKQSFTVSSEGGKDLVIDVTAEPMRAGRFELAATLREVSRDQTVRVVGSPILQAQFGERARVRVGSGDDAQDGYELTVLGRQTEG